MKKIAAALLVRDHKLFIGKRPEGKPLAHYWEFPGGKAEAGETLPETLKRELAEELSIDAVIGEFFMKSTYEYDFGVFEINCFWASLADEAAEIVPNIHAANAWVDVKELKNYDLAPADKPIVDALIKINL